MSSQVLQNALTKQIVSDSGAIAAFHVIVNMQINDLNSQLTITVDSFVDEPSYLKGLTPLFVGYYQTQNSVDYENIINGSNSVVAAYSFVASTPTFNKT